MKAYWVRRERLTGNKQEKVIIVKRGENNGNIYVEDREELERRENMKGGDREDELK